MLDEGMSRRRCRWRWHRMWGSFLVVMEWGSARPVVFRRSATVLAVPERMAYLLSLALGVWCRWVDGVVWIGRRPAYTRGRAYLLRQPVCHKGTGAARRGWGRDEDPHQLCCLVVEPQPACWQRESVEPFTAVGCRCCQEPSSVEIVCDGRHDSYSSMLSSIIGVSVNFNISVIIFNRR